MAATRRSALTSLPIWKLVPVSTGVAFDECRVLLVGTAGTATIVDGSGAVRTSIPLQAGYNPIVCTKVTLGSAADVWAGY